MLILIPVTLTDVILGKLADVPAGAAPAAAPVTAGLTLMVIVVTALRGSGLWRLWGPVLAMVAGSAAGGLSFGIYDTAAVREASWIGLPAFAWPGLDLRFGPEFWALLPAFVLLTLVGAMDTLGDGIAVQRASWRRPRAVDFRSIQGAMSADGVGNLLSGLAGTVPNTTYASGVAIVELTGVASRAVGAAVGAIFVALAFVPKFSALIIAIPGPVVAAYYVALVALLFFFGLQILQHDGFDSRKGLVVGLAFWLGLAFQLDWIFPEYFQGPWSELLGNGMTVGGMTVIALTLFEELTGPRRERLRVALSVDAYPKMDGFLAKLGARRRWSAELVERVRAVGEESLLLLSGKHAEGPPAGTEGEGASAGKGGEAADGGRNLLLIARGEGDGAVLEFIAATDEANLETGWPCSASPRRARRSSRRCRSGCCGTTRRRCATISTRTPTWSRSGSRRPGREAGEELGGERQEQVRFSTDNPETLEKRLSLFVTSTRPRLGAWAAIMASLPPMGRPFSRSGPEGSRTGRRRACPRPARRSAVRRTPESPRCVAPRCAIAGRPPRAR